MSLLQTNMKYVITRNYVMHNQYGFTANYVILLLDIKYWYYEIEECINFMNNSFEGNFINEGMTILIEKESDAVLFTLKY